MKNAKIWRLFSLRNKNKNKSRNLDLKSGNAGDHSDRFDSADVDLKEADEINFQPSVFLNLVLKTKFEQMKEWEAKLIATW